MFMFLFGYNKRPKTEILKVITTEEAMQLIHHMLQRVYTPFIEPLRPQCSRNTEYGTEIANEARLTGGNWQK